MTSPREAVSILTAAALVVAPVGGVAATYTTGYAEDGNGPLIDFAKDDAPKSYREVLEQILNGKTLDQTTVETLRELHAGFLDNAQYSNLSEVVKLMPEGKPTDEAKALAQTLLNQLAPEQSEETPAPVEPEAPVEAPAPETTPAPTPAEPEKPAEPTQPTEPEAPETETPETETPSGPSGTETPDEPTVPSDPENPVNPDEGDDKEDPENPGGNEDPDNPGGNEGEDPENPGGNEGGDPENPGGDGPQEPGEGDDGDEGDEKDDPVSGGIQPGKPGGPNVPNDATNTGADIKGQAQTPLKQVAVTIPTISFTHIDNSAYVARHYSEDLTTEKFISLVGESARTIAADHDLYASVMIAQAILESASGNSTLAQAPNNNLFGIKGAYNGKSVLLPTREDDGTGATYTIMSAFRQYETVDESLADYADLISSSMGDFYAGARKSNTTTFVDACDFLVGRYATDIFYSEKLQDLIETYDLTRFDVPLTYELIETFVVPVKDEVTGLDKYLDPIEDKTEYEALVAEYRDYLARTREYQQALAEWEKQMAAAEQLYHVPVYLEKPAVPATDTAMQQHKDAIDAERFEGFDELIAEGAPLPVREGRTLTDLTSFANSFLGVPYVWGGAAPSGFDCSGLVQYCYREVFNIELPRTTYYQCEVGEEVAFEELLPGDLLFFDDGGDVHHVAMYLGDGYYIEAPHTGDVVKITSMNAKLPSFAKRIVNVRGIDMTEFSDEQLAQFVEREKYLQEREQRLGVTDETLAELTEWLRGLEF